MKRILLAVALLVLTIIICAVELIGINQTINKHLDSLDILAQTSAADAKDKCQDIIKDWNDEETFLNMFLIHDTIDQIGNDLNSLEGYAQSNEQGDYYATIYKVKKQLISIKKSELPIWENIL